MRELYKDIPEFVSQVVNIPDKYCNFDEDIWSSYVLDREDLHTEILLGAQKWQNGSPSSSARLVDKRLLLPDNTEIGMYHMLSKDYEFVSTANGFEFSTKLGKVWDYPTEEVYVKTQQKASVDKKNNSFYDPVTIAQIAKYIEVNVPNVKSGLCHGVRDGKEVSEFRGCLPGVDILGTDIAMDVDSSTTIQHDFHYSKPEWKDSVDFIYSNSFDHTNRPSECLDAWMSCLKPHGLCFIEWDRSR